MIMVFILFFDTHSNPLTSSAVVESIQLKYVMMLQRFLRSVIHS